MSASLRILDPVAPPGQGAGAHVFRPLDTLNGKVVGFIDNSKPNFEHLVDVIAERLMTLHGVRRVIKRRKLAASIPATEDILADVATHCDLVITGSGD